MKEFEYKIVDEIGIHARPAGLLVKKAKEFDANIIVECKDKKTNAKSLFGVMGLGVKCGDTVSVTVEGDDEVQASAEIEAFFKENL